MNFKNLAIEEIPDIDSNLDENKLQEFDDEVSNYLENYCEDDRKEYEKFNKYDYEKFNDKNNFETLSYNKNIELTLYIEENEKLTRKIEEYQKINREWESKVLTIKNVLNDLEQRNISYKEQNEQLKEEYEQLQFKLSISLEKEKIHESNLKNWKELQNDYEAKNAELKKEYKNKEEVLKRKYEKLEESLNNKVTDNDEEYQEKIIKLESIIKDDKKELKRLERECDDLKDRINQSENFFRMKEDEFSDLVSIKDRKLKELELCIKSISEEANLQINKLSESVSEFNEKINYYKNREAYLNQECNNLRNQITNNYTQNQIDIIEKINSANVSNVENKKKSSDISLFDSSKVKTIENLRIKIKELEDENIYLSRELNLKYEECNTLNEEIRTAYENIRSSESTAHQLIKEKDDEVVNLTNKINELDIVISKYGQNLSKIKKSYEKNAHENQLEILKKNNEMKQLQENYEKKIRELQLKIEEILYKENNVMNSINHNNNKKFKKENNKFLYVPRDIPDDEDVRRNINVQINFIKEKLDRNIYS